MKKLAFLVTVTCLLPNVALAGENVKHLATKTQGKDHIQKSIDEISLELGEINLDLSELGEPGAKDFEERKAALMKDRRKLNKRVNEPTSIEELEMKKKALETERETLSASLTKSSPPAPKKKSMIEEREELAKRQEQITQEMIKVRDEIRDLEESVDPQKDKKISDLDAKLNALMAQGSHAQTRLDMLDKMKSKLHARVIDPSAVGVGGIGPRKGHVPGY